MASHAELESAEKAPLVSRFHGNLPVTRSISEDGRDQAVLPEGGRRKNLSGSITEDD